MPAVVQRERMQQMRRTVAALDARWWGDQMLAEIAKLREQGAMNAIDQKAATPRQRSAMVAQIV
jgi:hypothetical protein